MSRLLFLMATLLMSGTVGAATIPAGTGQALVYISPATASMPPNATFSLRLNTGSSTIAYAQIELTFDPTVVTLTNEVQTSSALSSVVHKTSQAEANGTGRILITVALAPSPESSPPKGDFELAQITLAPQSGAVAQNTSLSFADSVLQVVDTGAAELPTVSQGASITIHRVAPFVDFLPLVNNGGNGPGGSNLSWATGALMPTPRYAFGIAQLNGKIYVVGGDNYTNTPLNVFEAYDPTTNSWATLASMPTRRWSLALVAAPNDRLYAIGGFNCGASDCAIYQPHYLGTVEEYNPTNNTWTSRANMPTGRSDLGAALASNGRIYAIGGHNASGDSAAVEEYDPVTDTWVTRANMPTARQQLGVAAADGVIYAAGGEFFSIVEEHNLVSNTWRSRANLPVALKEIGMATALDGEPYVVAGETSIQIVNSVYTYHPTTNAWTQVTSLPTARRGLGLVVGTDGRLYAVGGWGPGGSPGYGGSGALGKLEIGTISPVMTSSTPSR